MEFSPLQRFVIESGLFAEVARRHAQDARFTSWRTRNVIFESRTLLETREHERGQPGHRWAFEAFLESLL